ncbi:hypothetical protein Cfor_06237 [Coptotermes formosanus]|uniref:Uncharacterized protein n=1 Tax=Coptotermes formosanus TaxID=36987 RepID=A0A6L2PJB8_COPFO|nr:hypothetical protein Cfor_06237 [Coptotermes formosanus]
MGRRIVVDEDCTYDVMSEAEVPEGGWGWIAAFGLALMFLVRTVKMGVLGTDISHCHVIIFYVTLRSLQ